METTNTIPGANALGYGFNILGEYDTSSLTSQLFVHKNQDADQYTFPPTGITYKVPDNISVIEYTKPSGGAQVFNTREQFQNYFAAKAGLSGSYGGFKGEFNAAYSNTLNTDVDYYYGMYTAEYTGWKLIQKNQSAEWLSSDFIQDPLVKNLPAKYTPENQEQFFNLFRKYGTHFVSQVTAGGSMDYFVAVEKTHTYSEQQISADISLEYKAVFVSAKAEAETEWKQLGEKWAENRKVNVAAVGGDNSVLNALDPGYGDSESGIFKLWSDAVMKNPAVVQFELRPLGLLFNGDTANAVHEALEAYVNGAVIVNANADFFRWKGPENGNYITSSSILINSKVITPKPHVPVPPPQVWHQPNSPRIVVPISGFQVVLYDPITFEVLMSHMYYLDNSSMAAKKKVYDTMMKDINAIGDNTPYMCAVAGFAIDLLNYPTTAFANWLISCGADLSDWKKELSYTSTPAMVSYVFVGKRGLLTGSGTEQLSLVYNWTAPRGNINADASIVAMLYADNQFDSRSETSEKREQSEQVKV